MSYYRKESHVSTPSKYTSSSYSLLSSILSFIPFQPSKINTELETMKELEFARPNESEESAISKYTTAQDQSNFTETCQDHV
jgi:hypothetical protein